MSAQEKVIEGVFLADDKGQQGKAYTVSTLKSNGFLPQAVLANEVAEAITEDIKKTNEDLADMFSKFDAAFKLGIVSTRSDNGWFADILTSQRVRQQVQGIPPPEAKKGMLGGMGFGGGQPQKPMPTI